MADPDRGIFSKITDRHERLELSAGLGYVAWTLALIITYFLFLEARGLYRDWSSHESEVITVHLLAIALVALSMGRTGLVIDGRAKNVHWWTGLSLPAMFNFELRTVTRPAAEFQCVFVAEQARLDSKTEYAAGLRRPDGTEVELNVSRSRERALSVAQRTAQLLGLSVTDETAAAPNRLLVRKGPEQALAYVFGLPFFVMMVSMTIAAATGNLQEEGSEGPSSRWAALVMLPFVIVTGGIFIAGLLATDTVYDRANRRVIRRTRVAIPGGPLWVYKEEFETSQPVTGVVLGISPDDNSDSPGDNLYLKMGENWESLTESAKLPQSYRALETAARFFQVPVQLGTFGGETLTPEDFDKSLVERLRSLINQRPLPTQPQPSKISRSDGALYELHPTPPTSAFYGCAGCLGILMVPSVLWFLIGNFAMKNGLSTQDKQGFAASMASMLAWITVLSVIGKIRVSRKRYVTDVRVSPAGMDVGWKRGRSRSVEAVPASSIREILCHQGSLLVICADREITMAQGDSKVVLEWLRDAIIRDLCGAKNESAQASQPP